MPHGAPIAALRQQRLCRRCNVYKPENQFPFRKKQGKLYVAHTCEDCINKMHMRWRQERMKPAKKLYWTPLDDARLLALLYLGCPDEIIGAILDRSVDGVKGRRRETRGVYGITLVADRKKGMTEKTIADQERAHQLWLTGISYTEIGQQMGRTKNAICGMFRRRRERIAEAECAAQGSTSHSDGREKSSFRYLKEG